MEKENIPAVRLVDLCHKEGMYVVGYYSLIYNTIEEDRHPKWRVVTGEDSSSARDMVDKKSSDVASYWASIQTSADEALAKLIATYSELE